MSERPAVSVVMPFAGDAAAAERALDALAGLAVRPGDELILADNAGVAAARAGIAVVRASGEASPAHARNAGAERARAEWILFIDADCTAPADLLDAYFSAPVSERIGALAGEVVPLAAAHTLAGRYGAARSFLGQEAHLAHPFMPRAVAANLMVRRAAFEQIGGFYEGVRAAEDTDFSWRLQQAGWRLELRPGAAVEHAYRASLRELRSQWRGYAAGRAWLRRRYDGFTPEPAVKRAAIRGWRALRRGGPASGREPARDRDRGLAGGADARSARGVVERGTFAALDVLLAAEELAGLALSNRPPAAAGAARDPVRVVLIADRFPQREDPLVEFARTLGGVRIEARARPDAPWVEVTRELPISYREDEGIVVRLFSLLRLLIRHPLRATLDLVRRETVEPRLWMLAPAALRLERERRARVHPVGGEEVQATARRLAALTGRGLEHSARTGGSSGGGAGGSSGSGAGGSSGGGAGGSSGSGAGGSSGSA